jgi:metallo-beta-lactamase class B
MLKTILAVLAGAGLMAIFFLLPQRESRMAEETPVAQNAPAPSSGPAAFGSGTSTTLTQDVWDANPDTQKWQAKAYDIAGNDPDLMFDAGVFCKPSRGVSNEDRATIGVPDSEPRLEPFGAPDDEIVIGMQRLFDNFYWIGNSSIGVWVVTSDDGYIVYDAMNSAADARDIIVPAMQQAGLDPTKIRYLVFGHYHGDHTGGGRYLQELSGAQAVMHWADWELYLKALADDNPRGSFRRLDDRTPMTRDIDAEDGMEITVGDVTATLYQMTGHTPGSLAMIVPVKYQGTEHPILLITAGNHFTNINAFIGGYEHIYDTGIRRSVESVMQSHPNTNMNLLARTKYVHENYPPAKNPLLYGPERTARYLNIVRACSRAYIAAVDML